MFSIDACCLFPQCVLAIISLVGVHICGHWCVLVIFSLVGVYSCGLAVCWSLSPW